MLQYPGTQLGYPNQHLLGALNMWPLALTLPLGTLLGFMLVFTHRSTKARGIGAKIGLGLVARFGLCILLNAVIEILGFAGIRI